MSIDETKLDELLEIKFARFFGQLSRYFDQKIDEKLQPVITKVDHMQNSLDGFLVRMDTDEIERAAMNGQLDRHERWIGELADTTKTTLSSP